MKPLPKLAAESVSALLTRKGPALGEALAARYAPPRAQEPPPPTERSVMDETDAAVMDYARREIDHNLSIHSDVFAPPTFVPFSVPQDRPLRKLSELVL